ncbi:hypothetical protein ACJU26_09165 [Acidithiobacillus sp. M4-SHS-6]|uniref:hypothetical protein n=1 Tax=Acidithiobacillus sp. M4-SHS-6 TaxID=3383024 RepID=UPI0039BE1461
MPHQDYLGDFRQTLIFGFIHSLLPNVAGLAVVLFLAAMHTPYALISVFPILALGYGLYRIALARNRLGPAQVREIHRDELWMSVLFQASFVGIINVGFYFLMGLFYGNPYYSVLPTAGYALATPYWWFEIPFFALWAALDLGSSPQGSVMDSLLFLSAHKSLRNKLVGLLWLPVMLAGWLLPANLVFPVFAIVYLWGPALVFACWLHPGDHDGTPRKAHYSVGFSPKFSWNSPFSSFRIWRFQ